MRNMLNGFWGDFWGGVKSWFTSNTEDNAAAEQTCGGRWARRILNKLMILAMATLKTNYTPTASEIAILNPIKNTLNNWVILVMNTCDSVLLNNGTVQFSNYANQTIRQLQLIRDYYLNYQVPGLSDNARIFLSDQIQILVETLEATLEDLFTANSIGFTKIDTDLSKLDTDQLPIAIPTGFTTPGFLYQFDVDATTVIDTTVPTNENIVVVDPVVNTTIPVPVSSVPATEIQNTAQNTTQSNHSSMFGKLVFLIGSALVLSWAFEKKEN
jgi:hypothetical protein